MKKEKILAIVVEGGIIQAIVTNCKKYEDLEILVIDYDTDGAELDEIINIDQNYLETDGSKAISPAYVCTRTVTKAGIDLNKIKKGLENINYA